MSTSGYSYLFGRFHLKVAENGPITLFSEGHAVALSTAELTILRVLLENHGQFVRTKDLLDSVSKSPGASDNIVHGSVRELKRILHDANLIINERLKGYCFTGDVKMQPDEARDVVPTEPNPAIFDPAQQPSAEDVSSGRGSPAALNASVDNQITNSKATADGRRDPFVVVALLVSAVVLLLPFVLVFGGATWEVVTKQLGFIQALGILVAIGYDFYLSDNRDSKDTDTKPSRALIAVQQFRRSWRLLLISWCCLYFTLPFSLGFAPSSGNPSWQLEALRVIATLLNNASALMLVLCYVVLNRPTVTTVAGRDVEDLPLKGGLFLVAGLGLLEAVLVAISAKHGHAGAVLFGSDFFSGIVGGIAMALFISRLDSRLLGTTGLLPIIPIVLYFYVVIQPFYPLLNWTFPSREGLPQHPDLWIMQLAFLLKSVMYIYVTKLFRSQRFLFYMTYARRIYEDVETEWSGFKSDIGS